MFLQCTDEKELLEEWLTERLSASRTDSILDIGPGPGDLSLPLSRLFTRYIAVEPNAAYATTLQQQGLAVIEKPFPTVIEGDFDVVLASHVINLTDTSVEPFVKAAWDLLKSGGRLVIVTHQGIEADWIALCQTLSDDNLPYHPAVFGRLMAELEAYGPVVVERLTTHIASPKLSKLLAALGFVWSDGDLQRWQIFEQHVAAVAALLHSRYYSGGRFTIPFEQTIVTLTKN
jgi:SAM-dependent methyltransferase